MDFWTTLPKLTAQPSLSGRDKLSRNNVSTDDLRIEAQNQISRAGHQRRGHVEINAGELHRVVGGYPAQSHRMKAACDALRSLMLEGDEEVFGPQSGYGASLTIRYRLPR